MNTYFVTQDLQRFLFFNSLTPPRTAGLKSLEITIFGLKMMLKSGLEFFVLKSYMSLQSCCYPVQKYLLRKAELAWLNWPGSLAGISEGAHRISK